MIQTTAFRLDVPQDPNFPTVTDPRELEWWVNFLASRRILYVDYETNGLEWHKGRRSVGIGLGGWTDRGDFIACYIPYRHRTPHQQLDLERIGPSIGRLLGNLNTTKVAHNIKFEDHFTRVEGWTLAGPRYDTMIAARLYDENERMALEYRACRDLQLTPEIAYRGKNALAAEIQSLAKANKMGKRAYVAANGYQETDIYLCGYYCAGHDLKYTAWLHSFYEHWGVSRFFSRIWSTEMALTRVLADVEQRGMPVDVEYLTNLQIEVKAYKSRREESIYRAIGEIKLGSDAEVLHFLKDVLGLPLAKVTKKGNLSVDREVLEQFAHQHPVIPWIMEWRDADKIDTTYTQSIIDRLDANGVVHGDLKQVGTNTGRLSCEKPNYQNFPSENDDRAVAATGKKLEEGGKDPWSIRRAFPVRPGMRRVFADYSQIELRVIAHYSQDPIMLDAYWTGQDIHDRTAKEVGVPRRVAKVINFGLAYGMSAGGLARNAKISYDEAEHFLDTFFKRYPSIKQFRYQLWQYARAHANQLQNLFGRRRYIPDLSSGNDKNRARAERQLIATLIQGTAAELTKESMVRLDRAYREEGIEAYMVNTVHDEVQIDVPDDEVLAQRLAKVTKREMERFPEFTIPVVVDLEQSFTNWAEKAGMEITA